jgi:hypothetical protein
MQGKMKLDIVVSMILADGNSGATGYHNFGNRSTAVL